MKITSKTMAAAACVLALSSCHDEEVDQALANQAEMSDRQKVIQCRAENVELWMVHRYCADLKAYCDFRLACQADQSCTDIGDPEGGVPKSDWEGGTPKADWEGATILSAIAAEIVDLDYWKGGIYDEVGVLADLGPQLGDCKERNETLTSKVDQCINSLNYDDDPGPDLDICLSAAPPE